MLQNEHGQAAISNQKALRRMFKEPLSPQSTLNRFKTPGENGIAVFVEQ